MIHLHVLSQIADSKDRPRLTAGMRAAKHGTTVTPGEIARRGTTRRIADYERLPGVSGPQADTCRPAGYARPGSRQFNTRGPHRTNKADIARRISASASPSVTASG